MRDALVAVDQQLAASSQQRNLPFNNLWKMGMLQRMDPCREGIGRIAGQYRAFELCNVPTLVEPLVHIVYGDATFGLLRRDHRFVDMMPIHSLAAVLGQQRGMDVDDAAREGLHHFGRYQS